VLLFVARMSLLARSVVTLATLAANATVATAGDSSTTTPSAPQAPDAQPTAIVGGEDVPLGRWPDAVAIFGSNGTCTGTLIAPDLVLTAGHCASINPTKIIANTVDYAKTGGIHVNVTKTTAYPNWQAMYDVAVIELASPIQGIEPRKMGTAHSFANFTEETAIHLVGFGATSMDGTASNSALKEAMTAVTDARCMSGQGCKKILAPGGEFIAGGTGTADSCFGDSGGPVYLDTPNGAVVIASVSRGVDGADTPCGGGGIYVRTDKVIQWIEETTGRTVAKDECTGDECAEEEALDEAPTGDEVGCSATRTSSAGTLLLVFGVVIFARRRSSNEARAARRAHRRQRLATITSPGHSWGELAYEHLHTKLAQ
jgi:secreted trypsin-like serine protease